TTWARQRVALALEFGSFRSWGLRCSVTSRRLVPCYRQSRSGGASGFSLQASLWGLRGVVS
ncbi:hypothetical protein NDU88_006638, partial [Pleurodeles waltl]